MDGSFFAFGVLGAFLGYILGDFQRQSRYRRDARANLALANERAAARANQRANRARNINGGTFAGTDVGTNPDDDGNGAAFALNRVRNGETGRRAIPRADYRPRVGSHAAGGDSGVKHETPVMAGAGFDFDD